MEWAVASKVMAGTDKGELLPNDNASRAQVAQVMVNYTNAVQ